MHDTSLVLRPVLLRDAFDATFRSIRPRFFVPFIAMSGFIGSYKLLSTGAFFFRGPLVGERKCVFGGPIFLGDCCFVHAPEVFVELVVDGFSREKTASGYDLFSADTTFQLDRPRCT